MRFYPRVPSPFDERRTGGHERQGINWPSAWCRGPSRGEFRLRSAELLTRFFRRDPAVDLRIEDRERQCAGIQHLRMEFADVEFRPKRGLRPIAEFLDLERTDLVRDRLTWNRDVALDLGGRIGARFTRMRQEVGNRLIAGPTLGMNSSIDDQPHGPQHLVI